ncbi:putative RNA-binding protein ARP1 [Cocos nucifera]|uniref:Putative RNA-binding protein ARP1 n=1 Tax=Cocos nucifera TaxID=13894 RepID=A0A8K0IZ10_COCNU|nr:putative RNA-binding protein ARP1 [Cocos nucifera]
MGQQPQFGDTTLRKVFVGGLAWETQKEALREHFDKYGEILEAVIISDKLTGRSKGYGFVTFKEAEAAKKACEDPTPVINGRRANCNLASLGAKRLRPSPPVGDAEGGAPRALRQVTFKEAEAAKKACEDPTPVINGRRANCNLASLGAKRLRPSPPATPVHHHPAGMAAGSRGVSPGPAATWYYHPSGTQPPLPPSPFGHHHQHYHGVLPFYATAAYGYSPAYMTDMGYNVKLSHSAGVGSYVQGQFSYPAQGGMVAPNGMLPLYPLYHFHHLQSQGMGVPARFFPPTTAAVTGTMTTIPAIISKPTPMTPPTTGTGN